MLGGGGGGGGRGVAQPQKPRTSIYIYIYTYMYICIYTYIYMYYTYLPSVGDVSPAKGSACRARPLVLQAQCAKHHLLTTSENLVACNSLDFL